MGRNPMQAYTSNQPTTNSVNTYSQSQNDTSVNSLMGCFIVIFTLMFLVGINVHKAYRVTLHRRRIATLEKIWLMSCKNKKMY
jgi:hypothetical protein